VGTVTCYRWGGWELRQGWGGWELSQLVSVVNLLGGVGGNCHKSQGRVGWGGGVGTVRSFIFLSSNV
jgi:hypothetical protein